jgi:hypothetical protein
MRDTHGLFDYEDTRQTTSSTLDISSQGKLIRTSQDVFSISKPEDYSCVNSLSETIKSLCNIGLHKNTYWIFDPNGGIVNNDQEQLWLVLRFYKNDEGNNGYKLSLGETIKLGRCKFVIKELVVNQNAGAEKTAEEKKIEEKPAVIEEHKSIDSDDKEFPKRQTAIEVERPTAVPEANAALANKDEPTCRICLCSESTPENPLVSSPCKCSGTIKTMHITCLEQWLRSKVSERKVSPLVVSYTWKKFECDVCKFEFPGNFR